MTETMQLDDDIARLCDAAADFPRALLNSHPHHRRYNRRALAAYRDLNWTHGADGFDRAFLLPCSTE